MFTVDGLQWSIPCDITESPRIQDSEISGQLLNGQYFHDVEGTYLDYEITLTPNPYQMGEYYSLLSILLQPVEGHSFTFPHKGETVQLTAKVVDPQHVYIRPVNGGQPYWKGLKFTAQANGPTYAQTLRQAIQRGLTPLPDVAVPSIGDTYTFTSDGWEAVSSYPDADTTAY